MSVGHIVEAVVAVALVAAVVVYRKRLGTERAVLMLLGALALGLAASGLLSKLPDPESLIGDVSSTLGKWTYLLVGAMAFLETAALVGYLVPGEVAVIGGGVVAGQGTINIELLIGIVWFAVVAGDTVGYLIGRRLGRAFLLKHGEAIKVTPERLEKIEGYFSRYGGATIIIGRFIGFARVIVPFMSGSSRMPYRRYLPYAIVGGGLWSVAMCLLGYVFYQSFAQVTKVAGRVGLAFGAGVVVIVAIVFAYRRLRDREQRRALAAWLERQSRRPAARPLMALARPLYARALRPAARFAAPRLRFLWQRLTPGGLGLELTVGLAVVGVAAYVFVLYAVVLTGDPGPTPADTELLDLAAKLRPDWAVSVAKVVSGFGTLPAVAVVVLVTTALLAARRRTIEPVALVGAFATMVLAVHLAKAGIDRPRPAGSLVETSGSSWPSGHAAYATTYIAVAIIGARLAAGRIRSAALISAGIAVAIVIGLSRIYLGAHYWSDVAGGWALGAAIYGVFAVGALVVGYMRQDGGASPGARRGPPEAEPAVREEQP